MQKPVKFSISSSIQLAFVLVLNFCILTSNKAWSQKLKYEEVDQVLQGDDKKAAKNYLHQFIEANPKHALAMYQLGLLLEEELKVIDVFNQVDFERKYKSTLNLYQVAEAMATKTEARKNKSYYQRIFQSRKVTASALKFHYHQKVEQLQNYYAQAEAVWEKTQLVKHYYLQQEAKYDTLVHQFSEFSDMYFSTDDWLINSLNELISYSDNMQVNIKHINELMDKHFPGSAKRAFVFKKFVAFNAQKVATSSFSDSRVNMYDYGEWAKTIMHTIREEIFPIRKDILEADARLTAIINKYYMDNAVLSNLDHYDASPLIFKLFKIDGNSLAAKVLMYKKLKADYLSKIMENEFDFTSDSGKVIKNVIESSREVLKNIQVTDEGYNNYKSYFTKVYEGKAELIQFLQSEEIFWDSEFQSLKAGAIAGKGRKQPLYNDVFEDTQSESISSMNNQISLGETKINLGLKFASKDSLVSYGKYQVSETLPLENERVIAMGNAPSEFSGKKDVFVAKLDNKENVYWLRKFMHLEGAVPCNLEINNMITDNQQRVFFLLKAINGNKVYYRFVGLSKDGNLIFDEDLEDGFVPRAMIYSEKEEEILLITKGTQKDDSYDQFENCTILRMNMMGREIGRSALGVKGLYGLVSPIDNGFIMVLNFLTYRTEDKQFINSEAIAKGGMNVLAVRLDSKGNIIETIPVFSESPVFAGSILQGENNEILLRGRQGVFVMDSPENEDGEVWEYKLKLEDRL
ncbi:MAG: hypothetical protein CMO01_32965 [Thalassobius sp.]|nr:hypothetical protein [Thalassovita sp.]